MKVYNMAIEVIAVFRPLETPEPIKFKIKETVFKIEKIIQKDEVNSMGTNMLIYRCQSTIGGVERIYEIKFDPAAYKWYLFKM